MINEKVDGILKRQREFFDSSNTLSIEQRITWLKLLQESIKKNEENLLIALKQDLGRQANVSYVFELKLVYEELKKFIHHLKHWAKDSWVKPMFLLFHKKARISHQPHGQIYLIVPFNFPVLLGLQPLVGAIGAGNVILFKPSKLTPSVNKVLKTILSALPNDLVYFLDETLSRDEVTKLNKYPWDFVFFTGSLSTAAKIYSEQYDRFIPAVFELGGKSPMVIDETADLTLAARKLLTTKLINSGQICVAVDYLIIKKEIEENFKKILVQVYEKDFSNNQFYNGNLITKEKSDEVNDWIDHENEQNFLIKKYHNVKGYQELKFAFIKYDDVNNKNYLQNELFSPISYYLTYENKEDIVKIVKQHNYPLVFYCFSKNNDLINYLKYHTQSGAFVVNDTLLHVFHSNLPFGGIKSSGLGRYHGKYSFESFSINKPFMRSKWYGDAKVFDPEQLFDDNNWLARWIKKH